MANNTNKMAFMFGVPAGVRVYGVSPAYMQTPSTPQKTEAGNGHETARTPAQPSRRTRFPPMVPMAPFAPMGAFDLLNAAERMMQTPFSEWDRAMGLTQQERSWRPTYNFEELEDKYVLSVEAAGIPKDKVVVEVKDNMLLISGNVEEERKADEGEKVKDFKSFSKRSFKRSLMLGDDVVADEIKASAKDGIITIEMPKRSKPEEPKPKRIEISDN